MQALGFPVIPGDPALFNRLPVDLFPARAPCGVRHERHVHRDRRKGCSACGPNRWRGRVDGRRGHRPRGAADGRQGRRSARYLEYCWQPRAAALAGARGGSRRACGTGRMDRGGRMLSLAISPCPNDTFVFCAMADHYRLALDDVEALNRRAEEGEFDITKISVAAYGRFRDQYALLRAGGAAGFGVGPLLVAAAPREPGGRIAVPGERTTAALLLRLLGDFETVSMRFDLIENAVLTGAVECGVLIHEGRFTYERKGLFKLADLGEVWEERMRCPLPLGAIAIRRTLGPDVATAGRRRDPREPPPRSRPSGRVRRFRAEPRAGDVARRPAASHRSLRQRLHARPRRGRRSSGWSLLESTAGCTGRPTGHSSPIDRSRTAGCRPAPLAASADSPSIHRKRVGRIFSSRIKQNLRPRGLREASDETVTEGGVAPLQARR